MSDHPNPVHGGLAALLTVLTATALAVSPAVVIAAWRALL